MGKTGILLWFVAKDMLIWTMVILTDMNLHWISKIQWNLKAEYRSFKSNVKQLYLYLRAIPALFLFNTRVRTCDVSGVPDEAHAQCRFSSEWSQSAVDVRLCYRFFILSRRCFICVCLTRWGCWVNCFCCSCWRFPRRFSWRVSLHDTFHACVIRPQVYKLCVCECDEYSVSVTFKLINNLTWSLIV